MNTYFLMLFSILLSFCGYAQSTYYVSVSGNNNNVGTQDDPWQSIQYGVDQLEAGDTLLVEEGVYQEIVTLFGSSDSGTIDNPVVIKAIGNAIIDGTSIVPNGAKGLITLTEVSNVTIDGFEMQNYQTPNPVVNDNNTPIGLLIRGTCENLIIKNNKIHDIKNFSSCPESSGCGPGANGIGVFGDTTEGIKNIEFINNEVYQCVTASSEAFTLNGNINGFKVIDNYVHDNNNIGFDFIGYEDDICSGCGDDNQVRNGLVKGNRAVRNTIFGNPSAGVPTNSYNQSSVDSNEGNAGGFYVDGGRNIIFDSNFSSENDLGFEFGSENQFRETSEILMINNYVYNNKENGVIIGGYSNTEDDPNGGGGDATGIRIYNNSFYHNKGWGSEIVFQNRVKSSSVANNIFFGESTTSSCFENFRPNSNTNNFWGTNIWWGTSVEGSVPGTAITQNPNFVDPASGDLDITDSSPAIDKGLGQKDIKNWNDPYWNKIFPPNGVISSQGSADIRGNERLINGIDLGAFEYGNFLNISEKKQSFQITISPNPVFENIYISVKKQKFDYSIFSLEGKNLKKGKTSDKVKVSNLEKGIYILKLEKDGEEWSYKFVKK